MKCTVCNDIITNPVCPDCLASRVFLWLNENNPQLAQKIKPPAIETDQGISCLFCGKKMNVCAHCFCFDIYEFLKEKNQETAEQFAARFDFELRKELFT